MQSIASAVRSIDTRLVHITTKLTEITKRQEEMEMSMRLFHESVRKISAPALPVSVPVLPRPSPAAPASSSQSCSTPAYQNCDDSPWWMTESFVMEETTSAAQDVVPSIVEKSSVPAASLIESTSTEQANLTPVNLPPPHA